MMITNGPEVGVVVLTSSGVVNTSAKPQALYGYTIKSGGTAGVLTLFNGTSSLGTAYWDHKGLISSTIIQPLAFGAVFSSGLYASFDGNVTQAAFFVRQVVS